MLTEHSPNVPLYGRAHAEYAALPPTGKKPATGLGRVPLRRRLNVSMHSLVIFHKVAGIRRDSREVVVALVNHAWISE